MKANKKDPTDGEEEAFYKRKLNTFNLTAVEARSKQAYIVIWDQTTAGRFANDLASAITHLLKQITRDQLDARHIILWSDLVWPRIIEDNMNIQIFLSFFPVAIRKQFFMIFIV